MITTHLLNGAEIQSHRRAVLYAIENAIAEEVKDLQRRSADPWDFYYYASFFSACLTVINWEQISRVELRNLPAIKNYFCAALRAARSTNASFGSRDKEVARGNPRRTHHDFASGELAYNILPRLENILNCWGITVDRESGQITERELSENEESCLTRYYRAPAS